MEPEQQRPHGRPSAHSAEMVDEICAEIACSQMSLKQVCESDEKFPAYRTVFAWLAKDVRFQQLYARAKELQAECIADGMLDIADDGSNDWMERLAFNGGTPSWEINGEAINRSRLRIDTRKWLLSKLKPHKYGDKVSHEHGGSTDPDAVPIGVKVVFVDPGSTDVQ